MATTRERLKAALELRNMRASELSSLTGISRPALSAYLSGTYQPKQGNIYKMSEALRVDPAWLIGMEVPAEQKAERPEQIPGLIPVPEMTKIPLVGSIACGLPILAEENICEYVDIPRSIRADFALECKGDSMINARIHDGDIVYIHIQPDVENGEIAAVRIGEEATLKRVYKYPDSLSLNAENPAYPPLIYTGSELNEVSIIGKAVGFTSRL